MAREGDGEGQGGCRYVTDTVGSSRQGLEIQKARERVREGEGRGKERGGERERDSQKRDGELFVEVATNHLSLE